MLTFHSESRDKQNNNAINRTDTASVTSEPCPNIEPTDDQRLAFATCLHSLIAMAYSNTKCWSIAGSLVDHCHLTLGRHWASFPQWFMWAEQALLFLRPNMANLPAALRLGKVHHSEVIPIFHFRYYPLQRWIILYKSWKPNGFSIWNHHKCLSYLFLIPLNTYVMGLLPFEIFKFLQCGDGLLTTKVYPRAVRVKLGCFINAGHFHSFCAGNCGSNSHLEVTDHVSEQLCARWVTLTTLKYFLYKLWNHHKCLS